MNKPRKNKAPRNRSEGLIFYEKNIKKFKLFFKKPLTKYHFYGIISTSKDEGGDTNGYRRTGNKKACQVGSATQQANDRDYILCWMGSNLDRSP